MASGSGRQTAKRDGRQSIDSRSRRPNRIFDVGRSMSAQYCGGVGINDLQLAELLDFRPDQGIIRLNEQRVVILSAAAMGLLRKELIDTLGINTARRLLMRFGFADGYHDAVSLRDRSAAVSRIEALRTGTVVHSL